MFSRTCWLVALLVTYSSIALYLADDQPLVALYGLPIVLLSCVAAVPELNSPNSNTLVGASSFLLASALAVSTWTPLMLLLGVFQLVIVAVFGLLLVEMGPGGYGVRTSPPRDDEPCPIDEARSIVSRELRRSRRTGTPLSLLMLGPMNSLEPSRRLELVRSLRNDAREFDTVFTVSPHELGIVCVSTDRAGALSYADRIRAKTRIEDFSLASFPDDAVTSQALFDAARQRPRRAASIPEAIAVPE